MHENFSYSKRYANFWWRKISDTEKLLDWQLMAQGYFVIGIQFGD